MPRYLFTGSFETVLHGLAHGVNAVLHRSGEDDSAEHGQPDGSTLVVRPGDEVETDEAYPHAHLVNLDTGEPDEPVASTEQDVADALFAMEAAGQGASEAIATLRTAAAGAELPSGPAAGGQHAAETSEPPATDEADTAPPVADPDNPPAASPATDDGQE